LTSSSLHSSSFDDDIDSGSCTNPATGLPMISGCSGLDVGGNPYGFSDDSLSTNSLSDPFNNGIGGSSLFDNPFDNGIGGSSLFDDPFDSGIGGSSMFDDDPFR
ncbi:MAG: hypothetical protein HQL48_11680, partial [Gammaproteobacteria bacterium]|nr:hypothetical protein [Gammaproteobacteria bacterium]